MTSCSYTNLRTVKRKRKRDPLTPLYRRWRSALTRATKAHEHGQLALAYDGLRVAEALRREVEETNRLCALARREGLK